MKRWQLLPDGLVMADYGDRILRSRRPLPFKKYFVSYRSVPSLFECTLAFRTVIV